MENNDGRQLRKEIRLPAMIAMAAGGMIAAWMVEIKYWFELSGPGSMFAIIFLGLMIIPLAYIYSEMTSMQPYAGGQYIWVSNGMGRNMGFAAFWMIMLLYIMCMPTVGYGIASMFGYIFPITNTQVKLSALAILVVWFFLTNLELKFLVKIQNVLFWSTLVIAVGADIYFIFSGKWHFANLSPWFPNGAAGWGAAVGLLVMKIVGFDLIPQLAEESNFPKKNLWKAFAGSIFFMVLVYAMAVFGVGGIVSNEWIAETDIVDPRVADICGQHWLGLLIVIMGTGTCITSMSAFWLAAARILYGAAKQHQVSRRCMYLNEHGQPVVGNVIVGVLAIVVTCLAPDAWINYVYTIYGIAAGAVYLFVTVSFLTTRKKHPDWERPIRVKGAWFFGAWGILFCLWVLYQSVLAMDISAWIVMAIYTGLGLILWGYMKFMQGKDPENWGFIEISPDTVGRRTDVLD